MQDIHLCCSFSLLALGCNIKNVCGWDKICTHLIAFYIWNIGKSIFLWRLPFRLSSAKSVCVCACACVCVCMLMCVLFGYLFSCHSERLYVPWTRQEECSGDEKNIPVYSYIGQKLICIYTDPLCSIFSCCSDMSWWRSFSKWSSANSGPKVFKRKWLVLSVKEFSFVCSFLIILVWKQHF